MLLLLHAGALLLVLLAHQPHLPRPEEDAQSQSKRARSQQAERQNTRKGPLPHASTKPRPTTEASKKAYPQEAKGTTSRLEELNVPRSCSSRFLSLSSPRNVDIFQDVPRRVAFLIKQLPGGSSTTHLQETDFVKHLCSVSYAPLVS